jgi:hypothetical protein
MRLVNYGTGGDEFALRQVVNAHVRQHSFSGEPVYVYGKFRVGNRARAVPGYVTATLVKSCMVFSPGCDLSG